MDTRQHRDHKEDVECKLKETAKATTSAASASSSPSHEFSFSVSLHSSSPPVSDNNHHNNSNSKTTKTTPPPFAIDLSPADDIFFHGHLLPLHLLSHLPVSPPTSINSFDSFTIPINDHKPFNTVNNDLSSDASANTSSFKDNNNIKTDKNGEETKARTSSSKPKSFSLFGWRKRYGGRDAEDKEKQKKKLRFEVSHVLKRYVRMVTPLLFFRGRKESLHFRRETYSFSGNLRWKNKQEVRGRRGEYSAPASMRTSPTNSGLLVPINPCSTSDSTMEELQAAIQAAIAHCKNSIAAEDKIRC